jgi:hypothetical protein
MHKWQLRLSEYRCRWAIHIDALKGHHFLLLAAADKLDKQLAFHYCLLQYVPLGSSGPRPSLYSSITNNIDSAPQRNQIGLFSPQRTTTSIKRERENTSWQCVVGRYMTTEQNRSCVASVCPSDACICYSACTESGRTTDDATTSPALS